MFTCHGCQQPIGPRVSPVNVILGERPQQYRNLDAEGEAVITSGSEITREAKVCRPCAGLPPLSKVEPPDLPGLQAIAAAKHDHARRCMQLDRQGKDGHAFDECRQCKQNMAWFASLPAQVLAKLLRD